MFKVKATVTGFLGNEKRYPCHMNYRIGDEIIFDGEKCIGRVCTYIWPQLVSKVIPLYSAGPRYVDPGYYLPFWYSPLSESDPSMKKYDGLGFRAVKRTIVEPPYHVARLQPQDAFGYPPNDKRTVRKNSMVLCPDTRTSVMFKLEAFDLADGGDATPYFRKQMAILGVVQAKPGIAVNKIRDSLPRAHKEKIYPLAAPVMVQGLVEELELVGHLEIKKGKAYITKKGQQKLTDFKKSLSKEERKVLEL